MTYSIQNYLKNIPEDFELLIKGLGNKFRISLSLLLLEKGDLSLSGISKYTKRENSVLLNHINKLELAGVIQNYLQKREGTNEYSFYELTKYGKKIITDLIASYNSYFRSFQENFDEFQFSYVKSVPEDFELILKGLSNKFRFALTLLFLDKGNLSFSEIVSITNRSKSLIASHLKKLELGGILQNFLKKESGSKEFSFYELTKFGKKFVSDLISSYNIYYKNISTILIASN